MAQRYGHISTDARRAAMEAMNVPRQNLGDSNSNADAAMVKREAVH